MFSLLRMLDSTRLDVILLVPQLQLSCTFHTCRFRLMIYLTHDDDLLAGMVGCATK